MVGTLGGIDAALETGEAFVVAAVDVADGSVLVELVEDGFAGVVHVMRPEFGFETGEALEEPIGANQRIDEETFEVRGGLPILVIARGHSFEFGRIFAGDDLSFGVDAGLEGIETGDGFALRSARACRELRISTIRFDLV
jgi:hypothetical protein